MTASYTDGIFFFESYAELYVTGSYTDGIFSSNLVQNLYVTASYNWKGGQLHHDDILTCDYCPPQYIATAGFDGEIIVWDVETEKVFARLRKGQPTNM